MAKKFTKKKQRLRGRAEARRHNLKVDPVTKGLKPSLEQQNYETIKALEAKVKAVAAS